MKKIVSCLMGIVLTCVVNASVRAIEINVEGTGQAPITGYNVDGARAGQDNNMYNASNTVKKEKKQNKLLDKAIEQGQTRKAQDAQLQGIVRQTVVSDAQKNALASALKILINRTLGAGASDNPQVMEKFNDLLSQSSTFIINQNYSGEVNDNQYIAKGYFTVDETAFRELISDLGIAINIQQVRASSILTVIDEFFTLPSDLNTVVPVKDVTVYKYDRDVKYNEDETLKARNNEKSTYNKKDNQSEKASLNSVDTGYVNAKNKESGKNNINVKGNGIESASLKGNYSADSSINASYYNKNQSKYNKSSSSSLNKSNTKQQRLDYGRFVDASDSEHEFFTNIKEYQPKAPKIENVNYTLPALQSAFQTYDLRAIDNDMFRSKYFKNSPVTVDKLTNSEQLANYVKYARKDARADFFAIGTSVITDSGKDPNLGLNVCDGMVAVKVYSTQDGEVIASGSLSESAAGQSPDQARALVAQKIGKELGEVLAKKVQDYWKKRTMYGSEFLVLVNGSLTPMERITLNKTLKEVNGVQNVALRTSGQGQYEFTINYKGTEPLGDSIFMALSESSLSNKFSNYDFDVNGNQIVFSPVKTAPEQHVEQVNYLQTGVKK